MEIYCQGGFDPFDWDRSNSVIGFQGHAFDVIVTGKQEKGLRDNAGFSVAEELQSHWAGTRHSLICSEETKMAASPVAVGTRIGTCKSFKDLHLFMVLQENKTCFAIVYFKKSIQHLINDSDLLKTV